MDEKMTAPKHAERASNLLRDSAALLRDARAFTDPMSDDTPSDQVVGLTRERWHAEAEAHALTALALVATEVNEAWKAPPRYAPGVEPPVAYQPEQPGLFGQTGPHASPDVVPGAESDMPDGGS